MKLYYEFLSKKKIKLSGRKVDSKEVSFYVNDFNGDGVPELYLQYEKSYIYGIQNGKVKQQILTNLSFCFNMKKHIVCSDIVMGERSCLNIYLYKNGIWYDALSKLKSGGEINYYENEREITKKQYKVQYKRIVGNAKFFYPPLYKNTVANRSRYLKIKTGRK
jgi:hypothetical protein